MSVSWSRTETRMETWFVGPPAGKPGTVYIVGGSEAAAREEARRLNLQLYRQVIRTTWESMPDVNKTVTT